MLTRTIHGDSAAPVADHIAQGNGLGSINHPPLAATFFVRAAHHPTATVWEIKDAAKRLLDLDRGF